jgi:hypothetical protein
MQACKIDNNAIWRILQGSYVLIWLINGKDYPATRPESLYNKDMNKNSVLFFLLFVVVLLGAAYYLILSIQQSAESAIGGAVAPFQQSNAALQTQVSNLMNPTPTIIPDPITYIQEIRALARLETIQYSVEKVITAEIGQGNFGFLFGDKLLFVAHGIVIAGIDMEKIQPGDMMLVDGVLQVRLPQAEVFVATLNNEKSYVYDRSTGILTKSVQDLETLARQAAEREILKAAQEDGILTQAQRNAELFLYKFFQALGYKDVRFIN